MIVRSPKPDSGWTLIDNRSLNDGRLSFRARGVLAFILSKPDNWRMSAASLTRQALEGRDAITRALSELEAAGYLQRVRTRDSAGRWKTENVIYDRPCGQTCGQPREPIPEKPKSDTQSIYKTLTSNDCEHLSDITQEAEWQICGHCNGARYDAETLNRCSYCQGQGII